MQSIRECLDHFIGRTIVDITSHDPKVDIYPHVTLMFDDGSYMAFPLDGDRGMGWGTVNNCMDHLGCISGEQPTPDPSVLVK